MNVSFIFGLRESVKKQKMSAGIGAEDLYGDLDDEGSELGVESGDLNSVQTARVKELEDEVGFKMNFQRRNEIANVKRKKRIQNKNLRSKVSTLERNISVLFKTAKIEMGRKDKRIKELESQIQRLSSKS